MIIFIYGAPNGQTRKVIMNILKMRFFMTSKIMRDYYLLLIHSKRKYNKLILKCNTSLSFLQADHYDMAEIELLVHEEFQMLLDYFLVLVVPFELIGAYTQ